MLRAKHLLCLTLRLLLLRLIQSPPLCPSGQPVVGAVWAPQEPVWLWVLHGGPARAAWDVAGLLLGPGQGGEHG